jgi:hypothetical protein
MSIAAQWESGLFWKWFCNILIGLCFLPVVAIVVILVLEALFGTWVSRLALIFVAALVYLVWFWSRRTPRFTDTAEPILSGEPNIDDPMRADLHDYFYESANSAELARRLQGVLVSDGLKRRLVAAKRNAGIARIFRSICSMLGVFFGLCVVGIISLGVWATHIDWFDQHTDALLLMILGAMVGFVARKAIFAWLVRIPKATVWLVKGTARFVGYALLIGIPLLILTAVVFWAWRTVFGS